ncbi:WD40-repeat-containing domain protein [Polychytrium aggregatum]|uniref:WD40-repeat-containing domain protein n=1 Tax=Polychytrium aggregatum TaxID=110093 RepID=UPI0022FEF620|nr:WD40-repeat-containing domain protein [Polychytrium aggregatum]KAI9199278.1 WD40-repeat-containing domain protein [Polychytrium aggregatum]
MASVLEIESQDVIRLIEQFLKENNLLRTLQTLQEESSITLNTVDSIQTFTSEILQGHWDVVLRTISTLKIPQKKLIDLHEQIVLELIEMREIGGARSLLRQTDPMQLLKEQQPDRYLHLEQMLSRSFFDEKEAYQGSSKEKRRQKIAQALANEVTVVAPSRLMALLGQAIKWQNSQGLLPTDSAAFDLFRGSVPVAKVEDDTPPTQSFNTIKFPKKQHPECAAFSPDGQYFVTGTLDGMIEVWNYMTGKLRKDLKYQSDGNVMLMDKAVLCLSFSRDSELLSSGSEDGSIKVWKVQTGQTAKRFPSAHSQGVTAVMMNKAGTEVLSGSFDATARIHGMKSGRMIKEFRGHTSYVNDAIYSVDETRIITASSDGTVKIWDYRNCECLFTVTLHDGKAVSSKVQGASVTKLSQMPQSIDRFVVSNKSGFVYVLSLTGQVENAFRYKNPKALPTGQSDANPPEVAFVSMTISAKGQYVYCLGEDNRLYAFQTDTGVLEASLQLSSAEVIGMAQHPYSNILSAFDDGGVVTFWK